MKVKNNYNSVLGFGTMRICPLETAELPKGYGKNDNGVIHPVTKFYLEKGWLEFVDGNINTSVSAASVSTEIKLPNDGGSRMNEEVIPPANDTGGDTNTDGGETGRDVNKPLEKMNKTELQAVATSYGITFDENDTNNMLKDKIKAAQSAQKETE